ncbi:hypothetical protein [Embleya hyalina]|uniref:Type II toxin-antitoxin system RelE/ParE family toxin n=1 Tax=Embleya hyalina TaxID=516124 RepID=A0A401YYQ3_9ACTN|nr:hypothetical protein [Embleya hyalina]GCD99762.1 hypothetical protein EHYA_07484 [Embleya hyalina]
MSRYRVQYGDIARTSREALPATRRSLFDRDIDRLADDPYGCGSYAVRDKDTREALVGGCVTLYLVSDGVLVVTVVRLQGPP